MKGFMISLMLGCALFFLICRNAVLRDEVSRLRDNLEVMTSRVDTLRRVNGMSVAETGVLRLRIAEYEREHTRQCEIIRSLGIRLHETEQVAQSDLLSEVTFTAPLDTLPAAAGDSAVTFRWADPWTEVEGCIAVGDVRCRVESRDTLIQVLQRIPHRFLFIRWGTKAVRQQTVSTNPHTTVVYSEYVELERRRGRSRK